MKRKKTSPDFESLQNRIARRLKAGLPLAGMLAATSLLCGCNEGSVFGRTAGSVPMKDDRNEQPVSPEKNGKCEQCPDRTPRVPAQPKDGANRRNETEDEVTFGDVPMPPPSNKKNETFDPASTMGKYPAKKEDK